MSSAPETHARERIDAMLRAAGWAVQDRDRYDPGAAQGIALREYAFEGGGAADYLLVVDRKAVGVVEAKPEGTPLGGVAEQSQAYVTRTPQHLPAVQSPLPFAYESTGVKTKFRDTRDPHPRSRFVFHFHRPETLARWLKQTHTFRARLHRLPPLERGSLRQCQVEALHGLEASFRKDHPRALVQMATGSGKTFMAITQCYRLLRYAKARRILFLVDRKNLGQQAEKEFQQYTLPASGRTFTSTYNVQRLTAPVIDDVSDVCIATIQRMYALLRGEELDEGHEEGSLFEATPTGRIREVVYNPDVPPETFDVIIIDECHRSIYNVWRQVLEYFDAHLVGLTATPAKHTFGFFRQNLVTEYRYERAVADGVNVGYDAYRIRTEVTEQGATVAAGKVVGRRDKKTREERWEELDDDLAYAGTDLDRSVVNPNQIRTVVRAYKEMLPRLFPERQGAVPKTLVFAKDDNHADDILDIVREEFGRGNAFAKKVTYTVRKPEDVIKQFRNAPLPRVVVSVDMIATGTDIKPLEVLLFMRDVKSSGYYDQMKGRGTRTIDPTDLQAVTPGATAKTHFVLLDAVGVTETDKGDTKPLDRAPTVSFGALLKGVRFGARRDLDTLQSLAGRLARLGRALRPEQVQAIEGRLAASAEARGHDADTLPALINGLLDAADPDAQEAHAKALFDTETPTDAQRAQATDALVDAACAPFDDPDVCQTIETERQRSYVTIDEVTPDRLIGIEQPARAEDIPKAWAEEQVASFEAFLAEHRDEITALQIFYEQPYGQRHLTLQQIRELADAIALPPLSLTPETLWKAYARLERDKVRGVGERRLLTDLVALVRRALGETDELRPFREEVEARFADWLRLQDDAGRFTPDQLAWLEMVKDHLVTSLTIEMQDLSYTPFEERGGPYRAAALFGSADALRALLREINDAIVA
jgi:type I restriction enzyme R subunit